MARSLHVFDKWDDYDLREELLAAVFELGYETPSFIQKTAIAPILAGRDIRAQAQSGTGKTAAFGVGLLQKIDTSMQETQILVLVSTREMAEQNRKVIELLGKNLNIAVCVLTGGTSINDNINELMHGPQVVVGTPGRVFHMLTDGHLRKDFLKLCVIDEADEMLGLGFEWQILSIFELLSPDMQVAMFSATWEAREMTVADKLLRDPVVIDLRQDEQTLKGIVQFHINLGRRNRQSPDSVKIEALADIFTTKKIGQCIVFVSSRQKANFVCDRLNDRKIPTDVIHANIEPEQRKRVLSRFREGSARLLVSTEVLSRGIDIQQLSVVINFDLPRTRVDGRSILDKSNYIHRIGRAGRFGRKGIAVSLIFEDELDDIKELEEHYRTSIPPFPQNMHLQ